MSEIESLIKERISELEELQKEHDVDNVQEIKDLMIHHFNTLPSSKFYTTEKKWQRALAFTSSDLGAYEGQKMELVVLSYGKPKDWNDVKVSKILSAWDKGIVAQEKLLDDGHVMRIMTDDGYKPVSEVNPNGLVQADSGEWHVISGKVLEDDEAPIPRDYDEFRVKKDGTKSKNKHWGKPLTSSWRITMQGLFYDGEKDITFTGYFYSTYDGDWANPASENFLPKIAPAFGFYDTVVNVNTDASDEYHLVLSGLSSIKTKIITVTGDNGEPRELDIMEYIYGVMGGVELDGKRYTPLRDFREYLNADEEEREAIENSIFMLESEHFELWHDLHAIRLEDKSLKRTAKGTSYTGFDDYAIGIMVCRELKTTKNGNQQLNLSGSKGKKIVGFLTDNDPALEMEITSECIISFNTKQLGTRYDVKAKKKVEDPQNGDYTFNNIFGVKFTFELV